MDRLHITDLLSEDQIVINSPVKTQQACIHALVCAMETAGNLIDPAAFEQDVQAREAKGATNVGGGIAIPHAKSAAVCRAGLAAITLKNGVEEPALGVPVRLAFLIAAPEEASDTHIRVLARLATLLMDPNFIENLLAARTATEFLGIIDARERLEDARAALKEQARRKSYDIVAVTACPSGIAHTYMAAQALTEKATEMGVAIKVETDGATGIDNVLSAEDIASASCVIVAADRAVEMERFSGKPVLRVPVGAAVRTPQELLHQALSGTVPKFQPPSRSQPIFIEQTRQKGETVLRHYAHTAYAHLMNGVSRMIPFVTGGGILIAISYWLGKANNDVMLQNQGSLAWMLNTVGQQGFSMMYIILAGFIAQSIADIPGLAPGMLGGYLAYTGMTMGPQSGWISSGFWGALVAGFAAGGFIRLLERLCEYMPKALAQLKGAILYPVLGMLMVTFLMIFVINPPLGDFNEWVYNGLVTLNGGSRVFLCVVLGGLMAVDYGGPINKAAYLFGTVALINKQNDIMAAVMVGGMTPPIGVALACLVFPNRFMKGIHQTIPGNLVMGASFVTEGALPFALRDPFRVIPSTVAGSALAGGLVEIFGCGVPAPHGGLFVLPLIQNPSFYLVALLCGSALTALMLGILKRPETSGDELKLLHKQENDEKSKK